MEKSLILNHNVLGSNLSPPNERSNCEASRRIGVYSFHFIYLVSLLRSTVISHHVRISNKSSTDGNLQQLILAHLLRELLLDR